MNKRLNLLGAVGFNQGYRPAVQLVIPPIREPELVAPPVAPPMVELVCQSVYGCVRACGWPSFTGAPEMFAAYEVHHVGTMTIEGAFIPECDPINTTVTEISATINYTSSRVSPCSLPNEECQECDSATGGVTVTGTIGEEEPEEETYDAGCGAPAWLLPPEGPSGLFPFGLTGPGPATRLECFEGQGTWTQDFIDFDEASWTNNGENIVPGEGGDCDYSCIYTQRATINLSDSVPFIEIADALNPLTITWDAEGNGNGCNAMFCIAGNALSAYLQLVKYRWRRAEAVVAVTINWDENTYYVAECILEGGETPTTASFSETLGIGVLEGIIHTMLADPYDSSHIIKVENIVFT